MPGICCNVQSCAHNRSGRCCIEHISVSGNHATNCAFTCCTSYVDKATGMKSEKTCCQTSIDCSAEKCIHNYKGDCAAATAEFLAKLHKKNVFLFGTCGFGGSDAYYETVYRRWRRLKTKISNIFYL